ncbi:MAG: hypothetical protein EPN60_13050 [Nevskiaceae bacterium]|nr:MAG: hypothetical protein EPO48_03750 [Nevskiaceae bacterium]TAM24850.1 MAG: hypothetical protein EPN60_13050 [Nevskiaceae bacterium]
MASTNTTHRGNGTGKPTVAPTYLKPDPAAYTKPKPVPTKAHNNPKDTAQEAVHEIRPKVSVSAPAAPIPSTAAKGDDDAMSKPAKRS